MEYRQLGAVGPVSALALGGGGIGSVWGSTSMSEAVETVRAAVAAGVTLLDLAPLYGSAEEVVGAAFDGDIPDQVRILTKCRLGDPPVEEVYDRLLRSLEASTARLRTRRIDIMMLHGTIVEQAPSGAGDLRLGRPAWTSLETYRSGVVPAFRRLVDEGRIDHWGVSAIMLPSGFLHEEPAPDVAECVANLMGTPGGTIPYDPDVPLRDILAAVSAAGVGVLGVRAVQAGALVDVPDRRLDTIELADFERAAPYRALARDLGWSAAALAHRYALSIEGVDTVVIGAKNRQELEECLAAEAAGPLPADLIDRIHAVVGS